MPGATAARGQPPSPIADVLEWLGASPDEAVAVAADAREDATGDTFRYAVPGSEPATLDLAYADILAHVATAATFEGFGPERQSSLPCGSQTADGALVVCDDWSMVTLEGPWWVFLAEYGGDIPLEDDGLHHSLGVPVLRQGGTPWEPQGDFLWDTFQGTDLWFTVERQPGTDWVFKGTDSGTFQPVATGGFALIRGSTLTVAVPAGALGYDHPADHPADGADAQAAPAAGASSLDGAVIVRAAAFQPAEACPCYGVHAHVHDGTFGRDPSDASIIDSAPDTNTDERRTPDRLAMAGPGMITVGAPPIVDAPDEGEVGSPDPTASPTTTEAESDDGADLFLYALLIGIAAAGAGSYAVTRQRKKIAPCSCRCRVTIEAPNIIEICCADITLSTRDCEDLDPGEDLPEEGPKDPSKIHLDLDVEGEGWDFYDLIVQAMVEGRCDGGEVLVDEATYDWTVTRFDGGINLRVDVEAPVRCPGGGEHPPVRCYAEKEIVFRKGTCRIGVVIQRVDLNEISHVDVVIECGSYREIFGYFPEGARTFGATIAGVKGAVLRGRNTTAVGQDRDKPTSEIRDEIGDEFEIYHGSSPLRVYWITPEDCEACMKVRRFWEDLAANPGNYYLLNNNCALNARSSLKAGGLWGHDSGPTVRPGQIETLLDMQQFFGTDGYTIAEEVDIR
ncbi:MAG TPA: hypothetical protein VGA69_05405 [Nitriliruptorales bacterium]